MPWLRPWAIASNRRSRGAQEREPRICSNDATNHLGAALGAGRGICSDERVSEAESTASPEFTEVSVAIDPHEDQGQHPNSIQVASNAALTLKWSTSGATAVHIEGLGDFGPSGEETIPTQQASYVLTAQGEDGATSAPWPLDVYLHEPDDVVSAHVDLWPGPGTASFQVLLLDDDHNRMPGARWKADGAIPGSGAAADDGLASFELPVGTEKICSNPATISCTTRPTRRKRTTPAPGRASGRTRPRTRRESAR